MYNSVIGAPSMLYLLFTYIFDINTNVINCEKYNVILSDVHTIQCA